MNSLAPSTKTTILTAAYALLYRQGFARVSMDMIAEASCVTKRTLYYHFRSKDDLATEALDLQNAIILGHMRGWNLGQCADVSTLVRRLFSKLKSWASQPEWTGSGFTRLTVELTHLPGHPAKKIASTHKQAIEAFLSQELAQVGVATSCDTLAKQLLILIEGSMSLAFTQGDMSYFDQAAEAGVAFVAAPERTL